MPAFFKSGHKYEKNYGLDAGSPCSEVLTWWDEISTKGCVDTGGPTGIYTMVVLASWWSQLLEKDPLSDRTEFTTFVNTFNHAILEAIDDHTSEPSNTPEPPTTDHLRLTSPPPSQYTRASAKRIFSGEQASSRKRLKK